MLSPKYFARYLRYLIKNRMKITVEDYKLFPVKRIEKGGNEFHFTGQTKDLHINTPQNISIAIPKDDSFESFLEATHTTGFIIIRDDGILFEKYFNGFSHDSLSQTFSVSKSMISALIGIAMSEGYIKDIRIPVTYYFPELKSNGFDAVSIDDILNMRSGVKFNEGHYPWSDEAIAYLYPSWRKLKNKIEINEKVGEYFHYSDYYLVILANILDKVLGNGITPYFEEKIWKQIGAESHALISLDNEKNPLEKIESGIACRTIDLAKFGRLYLNKGVWEGKQIVPEKWVLESTDFISQQNPANYYDYYDYKMWGKWFKSGKGGYKNFWWGFKDDAGYYDFFALGMLGQVLYISPTKNTIMIRLGNSWGIKDWWPRVMNKILNEI